MRKPMLMAAAVLAAVIFFVVATLPPNPVRLAVEGADEGLRRRTIAGAYHIHTTRSDGADAKAVVAAAAARAGLTFAIFADHSDGTRPPESPAYIDGVLCIDAVEVSTRGGHYVALDLPATPYPLAGDAAAVVEDVRRFGGFGFAAHPDHPRHELAWDDWDAPIDGLEWLNADSEWRTEGGFALAKTVLSYLLRPAPAIATVLDRPDRVLQRWDQLSETRRVVALAAVDAHGGARTGLSDQAEPRVAVGPSYEASFRTLTNRVVLESPLSGNAAADARTVLDAIRRGRVYSVVDAISPDVIVDLDPERLQVSSALPAGAEVVTVGGPRARRLEVRFPHAPGDPPVPWVLTNWVYSGEAPATPPKPSVERGVTLPLPTGSWRVEKDPASRGDISWSDDAITVRYELGDGEPANQFVAAAADLAGSKPFAALAFRARAPAPMRVSVQLRFPPDDARWIKSIYLDTDEREVVIPVRDMAPAEPTNTPMPPAESARSILLVVDLVNARPGAEGEFTVRGLGIRD